MLKNKYLIALVCKWAVVLLSLSWMVIGCAGCSTFSSQNKVQTENEEIVIPHDIDIGDADFPHEEEEREEIIDESMIDDVIESSEQQLHRLREQAGDPSVKPHYDVPVIQNSWVMSFLIAFMNQRRNNIQNALNRSVEYIDEFKRIFREEGVPEDLAYLPIIESGYRVRATSRARALGVWQFMASTARMFGLRVDWVVDERQNPYKSARAAAKYLKHLHEQFGDWYLALACYNGGPRRITRGMKRMKTKDFFKIARSRRYLRRETRNYVPAFLASLIIAKNPTVYGFKVEEIDKIFHDSKHVTIPSPVKLEDVARLANISYKELKQINPELIRDFTPFDKKSYTIRLPKSVNENSLSEIKRLPPSKRYFVGWYRVRRGDSLYSIARKFQTSVKRIKKTNKLHSNLIRPGKRLLIPRGS
jgi:membrane-bound lytic murein transglycosylase D